MRLREDEALDPEVERELEALDAAIAGRPVDPELAAVAELAHELRAERPVARMEYGGRARRSRRGGVPRRRPRACSRACDVRSQRGRRGRSLAPAGAVAALVVVIGVAISQSPNDRGGPNVATTATEPAGGEVGAIQPQSGDEAAPGAGLVEPPAARNGLVPGQDDRRVEQAAQLTLSTEPEDVPSVADDVIAVTDRYSGIVVSSQVSGSDSERSVDRRSTSRSRQRPPGRARRPLGACRRQRAQREHARHHRAVRLGTRAAVRRPRRARRAS